MNKIQSNNEIKATLKGNMREYGMVLALVVVVAFFQIVTEGTLLMPLNISNIIQQNSYVMILATGMLLCILTGGNVDLSVGSVVGLVGAISAVLMLELNMPVPLSIIISLLCGAAIGAWHGFWIAYVGVPAFIATLAGMLIYRGFTMVMLGGTSLAPMPASYSFIAAGFVPDFFGGENLNIFTLVVGAVIAAIYIVSQVITRKKRVEYGFSVPPSIVFILQLVVVTGLVGFFAYSLAQYRGIPFVLVVVAALVCIYTFITTKTVFGRHIYAFGGNEKAARLSGVRTKQVMFWVYTNMGFLAALAGIVFTGRLNSATPKSGDGFELDAIAACFIGGASTTGGVGTIPGAIIGGLLMGVLNNGMAIMGVSIDWQQAIKGFVLLAAVAFDLVSKKKNS